MTANEMNRQASLEYGGPAIGAWPMRKGEKLRPHKGGGGDGGAREMENERQGRIQAATDQINAIFNNQVQKQQTVYQDKNGNTISPDQYQNLVQQADSAAAQSSAQASQLPVFRAGIQNGFLSSGPGGAIDSSGQSIWQDPYAITKQYTPTSTTAWVAGDPSNSRDALYADQRSAVYDLNSKDVNRQAEEAERANRFGLARSGLLGGSADVDSNADLNRRTNEGLMRAGSIADSASADLRRQDESTRSNLISLAQSGIDTGTASQMALKGLEANAAQAAGARGGATVGGLFGDLSQAYLYNQQNKGANAGYGQQGSQWYGVSSPTQTYAGS